jgi:hypothetical protein
MLSRMWMDTKRDCVSSVYVPCANIYSKMKKSPSSREPGRILHDGSRPMTNTNTGRPEPRIQPPLLLKLLVHRTESRQRPLLLHQNDRARVSRHLRRQNTIMMILAIAIQHARRKPALKRVRRTRFAMVTSRTRRGRSRDRQRPPGTHPRCRSKLDSKRRSFLDYSTRHRVKTVIDAAPQHNTTTIRFLQPYIDAKLL